MNPHSTHTHTPSTNTLTHVHAHGSIIIKNFGKSLVFPLLPIKITTNKWRLAISCTLSTVNNFLPESLDRTVGHLCVITRVKGDKMSSNSAQLDLQTIFVRTQLMYVCMIRSHTCLRESALLKELK